MRRTKRSATLLHTTFQSSLLKRFKGRTICIGCAAIGSHTCAEYSMGTLYFSLRRRRISLLLPQCYGLDHHFDATKSNNARDISSPVFSCTYFQSLLSARLKFLQSYGLRLRLPQSNDQHQRRLTRVMQVESIVV